MFLFSVAAITGAGLISACLIVLMRPLLVQYALSRPNARSSHRIPTPQGGGIAIVAASIIVVLGGTFWLRVAIGVDLVALLSAATVLAIVGAIDDMRPLRPRTRLVVQVVAVAVVIATFPWDRQIIPFLPFLLERAVLVIAGVWFVNLVNFMDGIDLMTVSEIGPVTVGVALLGALGFGSPDVSLVAMALLGALLGFAPFNAPRARLFMGDVGSLPIGLMAGWLLGHLAFSGHLVAALLLPLYYIADATITLMRRLFAGKRVSDAHREHYYQQAHDSGRGTYWIVGRVLAANIALGALALWTVLSPVFFSAVAASVAGVIVVGLLILAFRRGGAPKTVRNEAPSAD